METRRIQLTGGSTNTVSLPKGWVNRVGIGPGDVVTFLPQPDGTLLLVPQPQSLASMERSRELDGDQRPSYLTRNVVASYLAGYNTLSVKSKRRLAPEARKSVRDIANKIIGLEIIEESIDTMVLRDLVDPTELPPSKNVRRIYLIVRSMYLDVITALKEKDMALAEDVIRRDDEVDKLHWLLVRQFNVVLFNPGIATKIEVTPGDGLGFVLVGHALERIGDHARRIGSYVVELSRADAQIPQPVLQIVSEASTYGLQILGDAIDAFYSRDPGKANAAIELSEKMPAIDERLTQSILALKAVVPMAYIAESIHRIASYAVDIGEFALDSSFGCRAHYAHPSGHDARSRG